MDKVVSEETLKPHSITDRYITIRDRYGTMVDTIRVDLDGRFVTGGGILSSEDVGEYILQALRDPCARNNTIHYQ